MYQDLVTTFGPKVTEDRIEAKKGVLTAKTETDKRLAAIKELWRENCGGKGDVKLIEGMDKY